MPRKRIAAVAVIAGVALFLSGSAVGALASRGAMWAWFKGDETSYIGRPEGSADLELFAKRDLNALATHVRIGGRDGNFEFEHGPGIPASQLNAYVIGTAKRTPVKIGGGDDQDLVSLVVGGNLGQRHDLQQWAPSGVVKAAVDGLGRLRLGPVTLTANVENGRATLIALLPSGKQQVLARAK